MRSRRVDAVAAYNSAMNDTEDTLPAAPELTPSERKDLKARAHHLDPVVMVGDAGLTPAVVAEAGRAIAVHELIKVRVAGDDRDARRAVMQALCAQLGAAPVQIIGKQLILYRPSSAADAAGRGKTKRSGPYVPKKAEADAAERGAGRSAERKGASLKGTKGAKARKAFAERVASSPRQPAKPAPRGTRASTAAGGATRRAPGATARAVPGGSPSDRSGTAAGARGSGAAPSRAPAARTPSSAPSARAPAARGAAPRAAAPRAAAPRAAAPRAAAPRAIGGLRPRSSKSKG
ncbi:MAG TPA: YhbY family RNA-binding protein [Quisquiliibacterium sp.]|nr:YhbY family RNA-binding protein [Quisquiliibacterium sp.]HQP68670.1 YhbY family RNA-binding protein [Quisquiliibacterium sp.]